MAVRPFLSYLTGPKLTLDFSEVEDRYFRVTLMQSLEVELLHLKERVKFQFVQDARGGHTVTFTNGRTEHGLPLRIAPNPGDMTVLNVDLVRGEIIVGFPNVTYFPGGG